MSSFARLFVFAAAVVAVSASTCTDPTPVSTTTIAKGVELSVMSCGSVPQAIGRRQANSTATDVCGEICVTSCSSVAGVLPPTTDDCTVIKEAVQIFQGQSSSTFTVQPFHIQQLTFGTCRMFFENLSPVPEQACWSDLAKDASVAGASCLPPTQPVFSEGDCNALDRTWLIGISHSNDTDTSGSS
ncbi:unnamed protein product [Peniophora sp. CBMAI 1063]|nr:unnamed protein product [Peniophora sp. CBMAI 1063]